MIPKVLVFAGSAREGSLNKKLARVAASSLGSGAVEVTLIDLRDYPMPLYEGDLEAREGIPHNARRLKDLFIDHQALIISSPENNASMSSLMKNTIDWVSRQDGQESGLLPYANKIAMLMAASPGALGGMRGLPHLRASLEALNVLVIPGYVSIPRANEAFAEDGALRDAAQLKMVQAQQRKLIDLVTKLNT